MWPIKKQRRTTIFFVRRHNKFHSTSISSSPAPSLPYCCHSLLITNTALIDWLVDWLVSHQRSICPVCHGVSWRWRSWQPVSTMTRSFGKRLLSLLHVWTLYSLYTYWWSWLRLIVCTMFNCKVKVLCVHVHCTMYCYIYIQPHFASCFSKYSVPPKRYTLMARLVYFCWEQNVLKIHGIVAEASMVCVWILISYEGLFERVAKTSSRTPGAPWQ